MKFAIIIISILLVSFTKIHAQDIYLGYQFAGVLRERPCDIYPYGIEITYLHNQQFLLSSGFSYGKWHENKDLIDGERSKLMLNLNLGYIYKKIGISIVGGIQQDSFIGVIKVECFTGDFNEWEQVNFNQDIKEKEFIWGFGFHFKPFNKFLIKTSLLNLTRDNKSRFDQDVLYQIGISYQIINLNK